MKRSLDFYRKTLNSPYFEDMKGCEAKELLADALADLLNITAPTCKTTFNKSRAFDELRDTVGYVESGGSQTVEIYQDDATRRWGIAIGEKRYYADTLMGVIREAHQHNFELIEPITKSS